ncbi:MAG: FAD:protein FMN transferase, partial [Bryobacteraceae bacterium]
MSSRMNSALALLACAAAACSANVPLQRYKAVEPHMGTLFSITLFASGPQEAQAAFTAAFQRIAQLDWILSDYK